MSEPHLVCWRYDWSSRTRDAQPRSGEPEGEAPAAEAPAAAGAAAAAAGSLAPPPPPPLRLLPLPPRRCCCCRRRRRAAAAAARGAGAGAAALLVLRDDGGEAKVGDLDGIARVEQHVLGLEVAVVDRALVAVGERRRHLPEVAARHLLVELAALGDAVEELAAAAELHHHVHELALGVDLRPLELADVRVVEPRVRRQLLHQRRDARARHHLDGDVLAGRHVPRHAHGAVGARAEDRRRADLEAPLAVRRRLGLRARRRRRRRHVHDALRCVGTASRRRSCVRSHRTTRISTRPPSGVRGSGRREAPSGQLRLQRSWSWSEGANGPPTAAQLRRQDTASAN